MKNVLRIVLAIILMMSQSFSVFAAGAAIDGFTLGDVEKKTMIIKGSVDGNNPENTLVTIAILPEGTEFNESNLQISALAYTYAETDSEGSFSSEIVFPYNSGKYDFYTLLNGERNLKQMYYTSLKDGTEFIKSIANGSVLKADLFSEIEKYNSILPVDLKKYSTEFNRTLLEYRLDKIRDELVVDGADADVISAFGKTIENRIETEISFMEKYNAVTYFGDYYSLLSSEENKRFTNIDFSSYNALSETQKEYVMTSMINKPKANGDEVKALFDSLVNNPPIPDNKGGKSSSTGGGSGSRYIDNTVSNIVPDNLKPVYDDIADVSWAAEAITKLSEKGVVCGIADRIFDPNSPITREQFAKIICEVIGIHNENEYCDFGDVDNEAWYASYVASAFKAGIINGVGNNNFGVGQKITRQDMALMLYNALKYKNVELTKTKTSFTDYEETAEYAKDAVAYLSGENFLNGKGDGIFDPLGNATRAESAVVAYLLERRIAQ